MQVQGPKGTWMLELAEGKYSQGDKVQEKQTFGCHLELLCLPVALATKLPRPCISFPSLAAMLQIYLVFVKFKSLTEK